MASPSADQTVSPPAGKDALYAKLPLPTVLYIVTTPDEVGLGDDEVPVPLEVEDNGIPGPLEVGDNEPPVPLGAAEDEVPVIVVLLMEELLREDAALYPTRLALS